MLMILGAPAHVFKTAWNLTIRHHEAGSLQEEQIRLWAFQVKGTHVNPKNSISTLEGLKFRGVPDLRRPLMF
jgi:hypothetical protein